MAAAINEMLSTVLSSPGTDAHVTINHAMISMWIFKGSVVPPNCKIFQEIISFYGNICVQGSKVIIRPCWINHVDETGEQWSFCNITSVRQAQDELAYVE